MLQEVRKTFRPEIRQKFDALELSYRAHTKEMNNKVHALIIPETSKY